LVPVGPCIREQVAGLLRKAAWIDAAQQQIMFIYRWRLPFGKQLLIIPLLVPGVASVTYIVAIETKDLKNCFSCKKLQDILDLTRSLSDRSAKISITDAEGNVLSVADFHRMFVAERKQGKLKAKALQGLRKRVAKRQLK